MLLAALLAALQVAAVQPPTDVTTDVDENTTAAEASPLAPSKALTPVVPEEGMPGRSLDDILSAVRPVETEPEPAAPEEAPRAGLILATPAGSATAVSPTFIDDRNARPDGPPTESDTLYESRVLGAFRAAQSRQGALDGRWLVARPGGEVLYVLQLSDPGAGEDRIEGAWRNTKTQGLNGSGFIEQISRDDADIVVRFQDTSANRSEEVRIRPTNDGAYKGEVRGAGAAKVQVVMSRDVSVELAAKDAPIYIPPPPPPPRPATTCKRVKLKKGKFKTVCSSASSKAKGKESARGGKGKKGKEKASSSSSSKGKGKKSASSSKSSSKSKKKR